MLAICSWRANRHVLKLMHCSAELYSRIPFDVCIVLNRSVHHGLTSQSSKAYWDGKSAHSVKTCLTYSKTSRSNGSIDTIWSTRQQKVCAYCSGSVRAIVLPYCRLWSSHVARESQLMGGLLATSKRSGREWYYRRWWYR